MEQDGYGWITLRVMEMNKIWPVVPITDGEIMTVTIQKTLELNARRQVTTHCYFIVY